MGVSNGRQSDRPHRCADPRKPDTVMSQHQSFDAKMLRCAPPSESTMISFGNGRVERPMRVSLSRTWSISLSDRALPHHGVPAARSNRKRAILDDRPSISRRRMRSPEPVNDFETPVGWI